VEAFEKINEKLKRGDIIGVIGRLSSPIITHSTSHWTLHCDHSVASPLARIPYTSPEPSHIPCPWLYMFTNLLAAIQVTLVNLRKES